MLLIQIKNTCLYDTPCRLVRGLEVYHDTDRASCVINKELGAYLSPRDISINYDMDKILFLGVDNVTGQLLIGIE